MNSKVILFPIFFILLGSTVAFNNLKKISDLRRNPSQISAVGHNEFALAIALPSALGFVKREYGVSYGYGGAIASAAFLILQSTPAWSFGYFHALLHAVYGVRICLFLLYREIMIPKFRELREKIETRAPQSRVQRTPFIAQCALLYACMSCPLIITSSMSTLPTDPVVRKAMEVCLVFASIGLGTQIVGDTHKSVAKARGEGLVTTQLFSFLRHPNYSGELLLWTSSTLAGLIAASSAATKSWSLFGLSVASLLGALGIAFVLALATTGLEKRQMETYGTTEGYQQWRKKTFGGFVLPAKQQA